MDVEKYNLDKLIKFYILDWRRTDRFHFKDYKQKKKFLGITTQEEVKAGYYDRYDYYEPYYTELPDAYKIHNDEICLRPRVVMQFQDDYELVKYFDSFKDAEQYVNDNIKGNFIDGDYK